MKVTYLTEPQSPAYERNFERYMGSADYPCIVCATPVKHTDKTWMAHLCGNGSEGGISSFDMWESGDCPESACMAYYPVGNNCARKYFTAEQRATYLVKST